MIARFLGKRAKQKVFRLFFFLLCCASANMSASHARAPLHSAMSSLFGYALSALSASRVSAPSARAKKECFPCHQDYAVWLVMLIWLPVFAMVCFGVFFLLIDQTLIDKIKQVLSVGEERQGQSIFAMPALDHICEEVLAIGSKLRELTSMSGFRGRSCKSVELLTDSAFTESALVSTLAQACYGSSEYLVPVPSNAWRHACSHQCTGRHHWRHQFYHPHFLIRLGDHR